MADIEYFFDPACPFAWVTSQWVRAVQAERPMPVQWRFISLAFINEGNTIPEQFRAPMQRSLQLLRLCAAAQATQGNGAVGRLYQAFGTTIHVEQRPEHLYDDAGVKHVLEKLSLDTSLIDALDDSSFDDVIRASGNEALELAGGDVGTPIITVTSGATFFGPIISKAPGGKEAVALWDAFETITNTPSFSELKRNKRAPLDFTGGQR
jgi:2-hydroxychromene-2-carboxylate isomerase